MKLCDSGHEEICWDDNSTRRCPLCVLMEDLDTKKQDLEEANALVKDFEAQIAKGHSDES